MMSYMSRVASKVTHILQKLKHTLAAVITHVNELKLKEAYKCRTSCKSRDMCLCKSNSIQNENTYFFLTFSKLNLTQTFSHTHNKSKTILKTCKMSQNKFLYT